MRRTTPAEPIEPVEPLSQTIHEKGGVVFAPKSRDFSKKMNKFARRGALLSAVSKRVADNDFFVIDNIAVKDGKTKEMVEFMKAFVSSKRH